MQRQHLNDTVEELKRFNARRKLKGAVQAIASGVALDPLCCTDIDSGEFEAQFNLFFMLCITKMLISLLLLLSPCSPGVSNIFIVYFTN